VYQIALACVLNDELKQEWEKYLEQTKRHVSTVETLMSALGWSQRIHLAAW
jgi:ferritin-like metal-binding protein YciE